MPTGIYHRTEKHKKILSSALARSWAAGKRRGHSSFWKGKTLSHEHRRKLSEAKQKQMLERPEILQEAGRKTSRMNVGRSASLERRQKISAAVSDAWKNGKKNPGHSHCHYNGIDFRSRWEAWYAKYLDERGVKWEYESYRFNTPVGTYTPDFFVEGVGFVEIKGFHRHDVQDKKMIWFSEHFKLTLLQKKHMKEMGYNRKALI